MGAFDLKSAFSSKITVSRAHKVGNKRYVVLDAGSDYKIHRIQLTVTAKTLRSGNNGVGFKVKFSAAKSIPQGFLKGYGLNIAVNGAPIEVSFKQMVEYANEQFAALSAIQQTSIEYMMYNRDQFALDHKQSGVSNCLYYLFNAYYRQQDACWQSLMFRR